MNSKHLQFAEKLLTISNNYLTSNSILIESYSKSKILRENINNKPYSKHTNMYNDRCGYVA